LSRSRQTSMSARCVASSARCASLRIEYDTPWSRSTMLPARHYLSVFTAILLHAVELGLPDRCPLARSLPTTGVSEGSKPYIDHCR
jgi:hypothetical protein